jgi:hypothetical protein
LWVGLVTRPKLGTDSCFAIKKLNRGSNKVCEQHLHGVLITLSPPYGMQ